jgi:hypothetical protein
MVRYEWEMGITRAEFVRLLPVAVSGDAFEERGDEVLGSGWRLVLAQKPPRRLALISTPVLAVVLEVEAGGEAAAAFVARFLLGYQRAGG